MREPTCNSMIIGYFRKGMVYAALNLYKNMQEADRLHLNKHSFVALLKACIKLKDPVQGMQIHKHIMKMRLAETDMFIGSALVNMYAKFGLVNKARQVFLNLPVQDLVSWTALIGGYVQHGYEKEALQCFDQMVHQGISPNAITFTYSLNACSSLGAMKKGQQIHCEISRNNFLEIDILTGSSLVHMYGKFGIIGIAEALFERLLVRNAFSWNGLIAGYVEHGHDTKALNCFEHMQLEGVSPNPATFVCILKACARTGNAWKGQEIHFQIQRQGLLEENNIVGTTLVDMYAKCGLLTKARQVFDRLSIRNTVSWTSLIAGYTEHGYNREALQCLGQMHLDGVSPNAVTYLHGLKACARIGDLVKGEEICSQVENDGLLLKDHLIGNAVIDMYIKCGLLSQAKKVFDMLPVKDLVSWTTLIAGYADHGYSGHALQCFDQMQRQGLLPNVFTYVSILKACALRGDKDKGITIHSEIERRGLAEHDMFVWNALVAMYSKFGLLSQAHELFDRLQVHDVVSCTALIGGYAEHGYGKEALKCFEDMQVKRVSPNTVTYLCILKACGIIGAERMGQDVHVEMEKKGLVGENLIVGNTLVDMYVKCGSLNKAQDVFDKLPVRDIVSWTALMSGYAQVGECDNVFLAYDRMIGDGINPNPITFVSVLNVCRHVGMFDKGKTYFDIMSETFGFIPTPEHCNYMIDLLGQVGKLDNAIAMIQKLPFYPTAEIQNTFLRACKRFGKQEFGIHVFGAISCKLNMESSDPHINL